MRVLLFSDFFCEDTTTFIYSEVTGLSKQHHEVLYLCTERINKEKFPYDKVVEIPFSTNALLRKFRWYLEIYDLHLSFKNDIYSHQITRVIDKFKPDIIHCHFGYQALKLLDNYDYSNVPVVITFHGYDATFKFNRKSYVKSLNKHLSDPNVYIFLACDFFKQNFIKNNISLEKATVLYCGINPELFKRKQRVQSPHPFKFVQVASFHEKKGHFFTVHAFKKLIESHPDFDCQLIFGGAGPLLEEIKNLVKELRLEDKVIFKGLVSPDQARQLMEEAGCFVHHSVTSETGDAEACTNSIMEAMAMELPILSSRHGGIPEMVIDNVHGYLVKEKDIDAYARAMWEIRNWGYKEENRKHIIEKFEVSIHIRNLEEHFSEIIRSSIHS